MAKKSICILTSYHNDIDLFDNIKYSTNYFIDSIVFTNDTFNYSIYNNISVYSIKSIYECIDKSDVFYFPFNNHIQKDIAMGYIRYAEKNNKMIISDYKINNTKNTTFQTYEKKEFTPINVPVFVVFGMCEEIGKMKFTLEFISYLKTLRENPKVVSCNKHSNIFNFELLPVSELNKIADPTLRINYLNHYLNEVIKNNGDTILIITVPGDICNPFIYNNFNSTLLLHEILLACQVDYFISFLPTNYCDQIMLKKYIETIKKTFSLEIDALIMSNVFFDSSSLDIVNDSLSIPKVMIGEETLNKKVKSISKNTNIFIDSLYSRDLYIKLSKDIINKLSIIEKGYKKI